MTKEQLASASIPMHKCDSLSPRTKSRSSVSPFRELKREYLTLRVCAKEVFQLEDFYLNWFKLGLFPFGLFHRRQQIDSMLFVQKSIIF